MSLYCVQQGHFRRAGIQHNLAGYLIQYLRQQGSTSADRRAEYDEIATGYSLIQVCYCINESQVQRLLCMGLIIIYAQNPRRKTILL